MTDVRRERTGFATCILCEAACGLEVRHDGQRVFAIAGDDADPLSRGFMCPKAIGLKEIHEDPDRLRTPLVRERGELRPATWEEALSVAARGIERLQREHGRDAVGVYEGNPVGHSYTATFGVTLLDSILGSHNYYSAKSVDALPRLLGVYLMYGNQALLPVPDVDRTMHLLVFGANPLVSNGSIMTIPDVKSRLRALRARGGKLVVVDPRRTETAQEADRHVFVQPGTDAFLLLAMLHVVFAERLAKPGRLAQLTTGLDVVEQIARRFPPERVAKITQVPADTIRQLATDFARADRAAAYGRMGTSTQQFGALSSWLIDVLNIVTGNLDREGGVMFNTPAVDLPGLATMLGQQGSYATFRSRVDGLPEFAGELPIAALANEIETEGPGQLRGLVTIAGNPVLSLPNGRRLDRALSKLDFMVSIDIYVNETTRHADVVLPTTFGLERDEYPILANAMAVRNRARYSAALLEKPSGAKHDYEVIGGLAAAVLSARGNRTLARVLRTAVERMQPRHSVEMLLRVGPHGLRRGTSGLSLAKLGDHGVDLGPLEPRLPGVLDTADKKIALAPDVLVKDIERLDAALAEDTAPTLRLIGRRQLRSNNSWMHNSPKLVSGRDRCTLLIHPDDAARFGLTTGTQARLTTRTGVIHVPVEVSPDVMPGVVSLPHGWGHDREGTRLSVASQHPGVSVNDITDEQLFDPVSGVTHLNGVPVRIERSDVSTSIHA